MLNHLLPASDLAASTATSAQFRTAKKGDILPDKLSSSSPGVCSFGTLITQRPGEVGLTLSVERGYVLLDGFRFGLCSLGVFPPDPAAYDSRCLAHFLG